MNKNGTVHANKKGESCLVIAREPPRFALGKLRDRGNLLNKGNCLRLLRFARNDSERLHKNINIAFVCGSVLAFFFVFFQPFARATEKPGEVPSEAGIIEHLNDQVDLSLSFSDEGGETKPLKEFFIQGRPLIILPVYYSCPRLCQLASHAMVELLNQLELSLGEDFTVLSLSFDYREGHLLAKQRSSEYLALLKNAELKNTGLKNADRGWKFLSGNKENVSTLMKQLGFKFKEDGEDFSHTTGFMVLTPQGVISRYFYGVKHSAKDVRFSLVEASLGKIGSTLDHVLLYCFRFDPTQGKYTLAALNIMNVGCVTVLVGVLVYFLRVRV